MRFGVSKCRILQHNQVQEQKIEKFKLIDKDIIVIVSKKFSYCIIYVHVNLIFTTLFLSFDDEK